MYILVSTKQENKMEKTLAEIAKSIPPASPEAQKFCMLEGENYVINPEKVKTLDDVIKIICTIGFKFPPSNQHLILPILHMLRPESAEHAEIIFGKENAKFMYFDKETKAWKDIRKEANKTEDCTISLQ